MDDGIFYSAEDTQRNAYFWLEHICLDGRKIMKSGSRIWCYGVEAKDMG